MENRSSRPQRNRRHSRRVWPTEDEFHRLRPVKRLFTPEIKRLLKDWLIRRRDNPYPNREEKKRLATVTGLTYTQICNWFANWRRKLKNSERAKVRKSWGHLIKNYNSNARGNVEQFSISSEDSIWEEEGAHGATRHNRRPTNDDNDGDAEDDDTASETEDMECDMKAEGTANATPYLSVAHTPKFYMKAMTHMAADNYYEEEDVVKATPQCYQISSTTLESELDELLADESAQQHQQQQQQLSTEHLQQSQKLPAAATAHRAKYKQQMMEKYMRDTNENGCDINNIITTTITDAKLEVQPPTCHTGSGAELSKWLESAAKFRPNKNNYFIEWSKKRSKLEGIHPSQHLRRDALMTRLEQHEAGSPSTQLDQNPHKKQQQQQPQPQPQQQYSEQQCQQQEQKQDQQKSHLQQIHQPQHHKTQHFYNTIHHKDELDAAEALTNLAFNCRRRMMDIHAFKPPAINAISSS